MADIDWLNKDVIYRSEADAGYANVFDQLSNVLAEGQRAFLGIDQQRRQDAQAKQLAGQQQSANVAARGLGTSGLGKRAAGQVLESAQRQSGLTTAKEEETAREYGARNAIATQMGANFSLRQAIDNKNYTELAKVFGLLGSRGVSAGTQFTNYMNKSAADAANRAGIKAFDYLQGWK